MPEQGRLAIRVRPGTSRHRRRTGRRLPGSTRGGGTRSGRRLGVGFAARAGPRDTRVHGTRPLVRRRHPRRRHPHHTPPLIRRRQPHGPRRRREPVVDGVTRGRRPRVLRGVVVQLAPPVVLVTGRRSPLLAHAPNCPPRRPVGNGASGKSDVSRSSNGVSATYRTPIRHRAAGRSHPPRENRPATTWVTRPRLPRVRAHGMSPGHVPYDRIPLRVRPTRPECDLSS